MRLVLLPDGGKTRDIGKGVEDAEDHDQEPRRDRQGSVSEDGAFIVALVLCEGVH